MRRKSVILCAREEVEQLEYPAANVALHESAKNREHSAVGVEWGMLKFLTFPGSRGCNSELDVEQHIGSCLASFFTIENCITISWVLCPCFHPPDADFRKAAQKSSFLLQLDAPVPSPNQILPPELTLCTSKNTLDR